MMPTEHLQKRDASKGSRVKHEAILLDLWSSSDDEETGRPKDCYILAPDTPSPERILQPTVEQPLPHSSAGREATFDIGESILHQLKSEKKISSQKNIKDSTRELRLPQESEESIWFQTTRELNKPGDKRLSCLKPPKDNRQTSMKSFVTKTDEAARNRVRVSSKNSGKRNLTDSESSQEEVVIGVKKTQNSASINVRNQYLEEDMKDASNGGTTDTLNEHNGPALPHSNNEINWRRQVESVVGIKNTSRNKHHGEWSMPTSEAFTDSDSRANIGWQPISFLNSRSEFTTQKLGRLKGLDKAEHDSSGSSSDSDSILSSTFLKRSSPDNVPLARRIQKKLEADPRRQNDVEVVTTVNNSLLRDSEKVTSQKHSGYMNALQKLSTAQKESNVRQQFGQNKRSLHFDNPPKTKRAKILPVSWSISNILSSSSNALEGRKTKFEQGSVVSAKQTHNTFDKNRRNDNLLGTSDQKVIDLKLFGRTSSDDGDETEEDEDRIQDRQDDHFILIDTDRDAGKETQQTKSATVRPADPDSKHTSMSLRASCGQDPSDGSQKRVANPPGRDEGVILIDITQSADRGAMSGQASPEFQSNFSPCQRNSKSSGGSLMNCKQKATLNKDDPVSPIKIRSNVAWDDDVVHINTARSTDRDDDYEPQSPTFPTSRRSPRPSLSPVFFRHVPWEITTKKSNSTSSNHPALQHLTSWRSPDPLSPVFSQHVPREITTKKSDSTSINIPAPHRKHNNAHRYLSFSPDERNMIVNLTGTNHPEVSGHTARTHKRRETDTRSPKSDAGEVRSMPSQGRTDGVTVSSSSYSIKFNSKRSEPDIQEIGSTHTTPRLLDTTSGSLNIKRKTSGPVQNVDDSGRLDMLGKTESSGALSFAGSSVTSSNQDANKSSPSAATKHFELEVGELGIPRTSNSSGIRSNHDNERHQELPAVDPDDDRSRVSRHKSRRSRREARKDKDNTKPPSPYPSVMENSTWNDKGHGSRHRKEHKSSKHGKQKIQERRFSGRPASPDVIELVRQMENDEAMAKQLQEEFDAEANRLAEASSNDQPILIHDVDCPGSVPMMPELPSLFPGAHNTAFTHQRGTTGWEMRWRDDLADNNPVNAAMMLEMDRFLVDNMEGHIGQHIHLPHPRQRNRGQRRGRGRGRRNNHHMQSPMANGADYETLWNLAESVGPAVSKGLPESSINYLPTFLYTPGLPSEEKECSICMGDYETGENMRRLPCFHFYHAVCIDKWLKENRICPVCREEVNFDPVNFH